MILGVVLGIFFLSTIAEAKMLNGRLAGQRYIPSSAPMVKTYYSGSLTAIPSLRPSVSSPFIDDVRTTGTPNSYSGRVPTNTMVRGSRSEADVASRLTSDPTSFPASRSEQQRGKFFDRKYTPPASLRGNYRRAWYTKAYNAGNPVIASPASSSTPRFVNSGDRGRVSTNSYLDNSPAY